MNLNAFKYRNLPAIDIVAKSETQCTNSVNDECTYM